MRNETDLGTPRIGKPDRHRLCHWLAQAALVCLLGLTEVQAQQTYTVELIGSMADTMTTGFINEHGEVIGTKQVGLVTKVYLYSANIVTEIATLYGSTNPSFQKIVALGEDGGAILADSGLYAYRVTAGGTVRLDYPSSARFQTPRAINPLGHVIGVGNVLRTDPVWGLVSESVAMVWKSPTDVTSLGGLYKDTGQYHSVGTGGNAGGTVVGSSWVVGANKHAFRYSGGTMTDLGTLGGGAERSVGR